MLGTSTVLPDMDFETYSEAGFIWDEAGQKYHAPKGATRKGLSAVGAVAYTEHPSAEVLCLSYDLKDGKGARLWFPGMAPPDDLFAHISTGGLIEAFNASFEYWVWKNICVPKLGWPPLPFWQLRDAMAKACAFALPGKLEKAAEVVEAKHQKIADGKRLLDKFSMPRKPTKKDPRRRIRPEEDPQDAAKLYEYCVYDIKAEADVSAACPDLPPQELEFYLCTAAMNERGLALDMETVNAGAAILDAALDRYNAKLPTLTNEAVETASQGARIIGWLATQGIRTKSVDADHRKALLARSDVSPAAREVLEIVDLVGSAGVKKLYAMQRMVSRGGRVHDLIGYHRARTGRDGGQDIQPQNLVKAGPALLECPECGKLFAPKLKACPQCGTLDYYANQADWSYQGVEDAVAAIRTGSLDHVENLYGDALLTLSGCIRGLFVPGPGKDFICSDYSSIEAVVTAVLAGEDWRIEAFRRKEDIYYVSAGRITGRTLEEYKAHKERHGAHHPDRQKIGKPAELGLGFGGWIGAWRQFDSTDNFTDDEVKANIIAWRDASPQIVELWGGQVRGKPWRPDYAELYGLEGMAIAAVMNPGTCYAYRGITYGVKDDVLYCRLPSGRYMAYHKPRLGASDRWEGQVALSFMGWNTNPKMGPLGWIRIDTYGGRLAENVIQATARDIMAHAVPALERAGYPIVLRVHDELVAEVPEGTGSIEEFERIMGTPPPWAADWPIRASDGWRGKRYRKD